MFIIITQCNKIEFVLNFRTLPLVTTVRDTSAAPKPEQNPKINNYFTKKIFLNIQNYPKRQSKAAAT